MGRSHGRSGAARPRELIRAGRVLTPAELLTPGWVELAGGVITALGAGEPPRVADTDLGGAATVIPGMVDMHTHGGGGHDMTAGDPSEIRAALAWSLHHGVTASVLSTVSASSDDLAGTIGSAADVRRDQLSEVSTVPHSTLLGVHLEGPFLADSRRGAHRRADLRPPRAADLRRLLDVAPGVVVMVTLAPELPGALDAVRAIRAAGAVAAIGHTDADLGQTVAAIGAGATVATHLFNAMPDLRHRDPGPVGALLSAPVVVCEFINDGRHLDPTVLAIAARAAGPGRVALVSDAVAATGARAGRYRLGPLAVENSGGLVRIAGSDGALAGGSSGLDESLRRAVTEIGIPLVDAVAAVTATPAAALGEADQFGSIAVGRAGDLCVLDGDLRVCAVCLGGNWSKSAGR